MDRDLYDSEHEAFRAMVRAFLAAEVMPFHDQWELDGIVDREVWRTAGKHGLLGMEVEERFGGGGAVDFRFNAVLVEEIYRIRATGLGFHVHNDLVAPYLTELTDEGQKARWLPGFTNGDIVTAIAMTEPGAGSDLQGIRTSAVRDGDCFVLNGQKTFISNGIHADLVVVVARTDTDAKPSKGLSLLVVERGMPGFERGRNLDKLGLKAQDTAELSFSDVRVPARNLIGQYNGGFAHLMRNLPRERLTIAVSAVASSQRVLDETVQYCRERQLFGASLGSLQHTRFVIAELTTELSIARVFVDRCISELNAGRLSAVDAAMAKWWSTELEKKLVDACLQLHGGYGYMREYAVAQSYLDTRVQTIYGGATEVMKEIIGRSVGL